MSDAEEPDSSKCGQQQEPETGGWLALLLKKIKSAPVAGEKWNTLIARGLDKEEQEELAEYLFRYCAGSKEQSRLGLKRARQFRDQLPARLNEIRSAANVAEALLRDLESISGIRIHDPDFDRLPSTLRAFGDEVEELIPILQRTVAQGAKRKKDGSIEGGRSEALVIAVNIILRAIKDEPYAYLAPLVAAVQEGPNPGYDYLADSLRNAYKRARDKDSRRALEIKAERSISPVAGRNQQ